MSAVRPIKPSDVAVNTCLEHAWFEQINSELLKEWGECEMHRTVTLKGPFGREGGGYYAMAQYVWKAYEAAGWIVNPRTPFERPDMFFDLSFTRPASCGSEVNK